MLCLLSWSHNYELTPGKNGSEGPSVWLEWVRQENENGGMFKPPNMVAQIARIKGEVLGRAVSIAVDPW